MCIKMQSNKFVFSFLWYNKMAFDLCISCAFDARFAVLLFISLFYCFKRPQRPLVVEYLF